MTQFIEYIDSLSDWGDDPEFGEDGFYVLDHNGIVAGSFDDEGEALWWMDKAKRI